MRYEREKKGEETLYASFAENNKDIETLHLEIPARLPTILTNFDFS